MWGDREYQMHLSPVKCNGAAIRKRRWWHYCIKQLSTPMIISAIWMQRSSEQDAGIATKTGLQGGGRRQGDESKQHQVTATPRDRVKTFIRTNKHKDWIPLTCFCNNQILFHSASAISGPHDSIRGKGPFGWNLFFPIEENSTFLRLPFKAFFKRINKGIGHICGNSV